MEDSFERRGNLLETDDVWSLQVHKSAKQTDLRRIKGDAARRRRTASPSISTRRRYRKSLSVASNRTFQVTIFNCFLRSDFLILNRETFVSDRSLQRISGAFRREPGNEGVKLVKRNGSRL